MPHFPARLILFPEGYEHRRAAFYLAAEEYIARQFPPDNYLFTWQLAPTVVMGRNQVAHQEVDLDFCRRNNIDVIRRRSGGGAIFADRGNIMISLITPAGPVEPLFQEYAHTVAQALVAMGAPATVSGRNDILLADGGKICGNAFYHLTDRNIVHGTMLYDTSSHLMQGALHPNPTKLQSKGVKSVRRRVALLKDYLPFGVDTLRQRILEALTTQTQTLLTSLKGRNPLPLTSLLSPLSAFSSVPELVEGQLSAKDIQAIEHLEQAYYNPTFLLGSTSRGDITLSRRIPDCGQIDLRFTLRGSLIGEVKLTGDFFEISDAQKAMSDTFLGLPLTPDSLREAILQHHPEKAIRGLSTEALLSIVNIG